MCLKKNSFLTFNFDLDRIEENKLQMFKNKITQNLGKLYHMDAPII